MGESSSARLESGVVSATSVTGSSSPDRASSLAMSSLLFIGAYLAHSNSFAKAWGCRQVHQPCDTCVGEPLPLDVIDLLD